MEACPFGAMQFDDDRDVAVKCDLCIGRLGNNEEPACSKACATRCIFWGDTKQLSEKIVAARSTLDREMTGIEIA
jgi:Fe-S-cluster-containing dehydrogenase component